jgi:hypothetical protein
MASVSMRKRRVGVTARLWRIDGNQVIGPPQIATEMAAPPELRTPMGTAAAAASECGWKHGDSGVGVNGQKTISAAERQIAEAKAQGDGAPDGAHEALPHTPPGGAPPETPRPPFPRDPGSRREGICQGFASRAQTARP